MAKSAEAWCQVRFSEDIPKDKLLEGFWAIVDSGAGGTFKNGNYVVHESVVNTLKQLEIPFQQVSI